MTDERTYEERIEKLFRRFPSVGKAGFNNNSYKPGLERMMALEKALGNPSETFRSIHVAGTNGKGSVSNMLASVLSAKGLKTGLFTSPHLLDFRERMRIGNEMISREEVLSFLDRWEGLCDRLDLSFFEITTAMAFDWFRKRKCDFAVIETGLGGRLDSTNILSRPELAVITSIGLDHCSLLGDTREKIAVEKAGIFKEGSTAVIACTDTQTSPVFIEAAGKAGSRIVFADNTTPDGWNKSSSILSQMDLQGPCQDINLRTVLCCLEELGICIDKEVEEAIIHTASRMDFHGRWERLGTSPEVICDIGHNPPALEGNFARLRQSGKPLHIVYGIMADKDLDSIMPLMPEDAEYYFCSPDSPRALGAEELTSRYKEFCVATGRDGSRSRCCSSVKDAIKMALSNAESHSLVYIGGSTYVVCEALSCASAETASRETCASTEG